MGTPQKTGWLKGNLHAHSFWSDGGDFPEMIAERFKSGGYQFLAFTEHNRFQDGEFWISDDPRDIPGQALRDGDLLAKYRERFGGAWVETRSAGRATEIRLKPLSEYRHLVEEPERFLILNGEETDLLCGERRHWVNVINTPAPVTPITRDTGTSEGVEALLRTVAEQGESSGRTALASFNHPNYVWNATAEDLAGAPSLRFFEVMTALNCTWPYGDEAHPNTERIWDIALSLRLATRDGQPLYGLATDDCHFYHDDVRFSDHEGTSSHPGRAWVMVQANALTPEAITGALLTGRFYASTGVTIKTIECDGRGMRLAIEAEPGVAYTTRFIGTRAGTTPVTRDDSDDIGRVFAEQVGDKASYVFRGDQLYVRAVVISDKSHPNPTTANDTTKAWLQPVVPRP